MKLNRFLFIALYAFVLLLPACTQMTMQPVQATTTRPTTSVCTETGLSGPALQENLLFCDTNAINGVITNCCSSVYHQAIDLARKKHIIVGTPTSVSETVDWANRQVTYVEFTSGFHAWHYNPSNGVAVIDDQYDRRVYP